MLYTIKAFLGVQFFITFWGCTFVILEICVPCLNLIYSIK